MARSSDAHWYDAAWLDRSRQWHRRAARLSRRSLAGRVRRLRSRTFFIVQAAISGTVAYFLAERLFGHEQPFFAPIVTLIALGQSFGQRLERVVEIVIGAAVGVLLGDVFVSIFGGGMWQMAVVIGLAMAAATLLDAGVLITGQAGVQAAFVTILLPPPGQAFSRWTDAIIGGVVALLAATITPAAPIRKPRLHASSVVAEMSAILATTADSIRTRDLALAEATMARARASESMLEELQEFADDGLAVVRLSPFRRQHLPAVQVIADLLEPLDRAIRNTRVLVRRAGIAIRHGEPIPKAYIDLVSGLAEATLQMADTLSIRELPESSRASLVRLAELTTYVDERPSLSSEVIRAQVRSIVVDLLEVTGLSIEEAVALVPNTYDLVDGNEIGLDDDLDDDLDLDLREVEVELRVDPGERAPGERAPGERAPGGPEPGQPMSR